MAAGRSSLWDKIREELTCSICKELFARPKVLPCQHTFCQGCLQDWAGGQECFQCPICHTWVGPALEGVPNLPDSHLVKNLCEQIRNQATLSERTVGQPHLTRRCSNHYQEELKLYCKQCNKAICTECLGEEHAGHRTVNLKKALEEIVTRDETLITEGRDILESYCGFIIGLRGTEKQLEEQKQQTEHSIAEAFNKIVQKLREAKDDMLFKVEQKYKQNVDAIQSQREGVLADLSELSAACDTAEHRINQRGMEILDQDANLIEVMGKYRQKAAPSLVPIQVPVFLSTETTSAVQTLGQFIVHPLQAALLQVAHRGGQAGVDEGKKLLQRKTFGGKGLKRGKFSRPLGVAVSEEGHIFVADCGNQRIQVFTLQGTFLYTMVTTLSTHTKKIKNLLRPQRTHTPEEVMSPHGVAIDRHGDLWAVGDTDSADFAVKYNKQGRLLTKIELQKTRAARGIAVDTRRNSILVTQTVGTYLQQGLVQEFSPDGTLIKTLGERHGMNNPQYITVDREGNILVSDYFSDCVYVFNSSGELQFKFGDRGSGGHRLKYPRGICTDSSGNIVVADGKNGSLELFDRTGSFLRSISTDSNGPCAVAIAPQGQLVVTDIQDDTVTIFSKY